MRRILVLILSLCTIFLLAVPAFAVSLESSVVSGDTITDTYVFPCESIYYESNVDSGIVQGNEVTIALPEGDSAYLEVYFDVLDDLSSLNMDNYENNSVSVEVQFSIVGSIDYTAYLSIGDGTHLDHIGTVDGSVYDSNDVATISGTLDLFDEGRSIDPELYLDIYSYSSNVWIRFESVKLSIVRNRVDRYEPQPVPPKFEDSMNDAINKEESLVDQFDNGTMSDFGEDIDIAVDSLTELSYAFAFVRDIVEPFINISWLNTLLVVSLALGILGAFLNLTSSIVNSSKGGKD